MYTGFGVGAALITTGVLLWLLGPDEKQEGVVTTATVIPDVENGGAVLSIGWSW
jgi:hypothetical protein